MFPMFYLQTMENYGEIPQQTYEKKNRRMVKNAQRQVSIVHLFYPCIFKLASTSIQIINIINIKVIKRLLSVIACQNII